MVGALLLTMPLFALVTWTYRQGPHPPEYYLKQMGLWDLDAELRRVRTPLVDQFQALVAAGTDSIGLLDSSARPVEAALTHS